MARGIIQINEEQLFEYLVSRDCPVMELDLMKKFVENECIAGEKHSLFARHFSLYHALYRLRYSAGAEGFYLHLDCMRIRLVQIPGQGICRHYDAESGTFCGEKTDCDYCAEHGPAYTRYRNSMTCDLLRDFYMDSENIAFEDSGLLHRLMNGIMVYGFRKRDVDRALEFFNIRRPGKKIITRRYRELAGIYHPDRCGGSEEMMKQLNSFYILLKDVFIV